MTRRVITVNSCPNWCQESENAPSNWYVCPKCGADLIEQEIEIEEIRTEHGAKWI